MKLLIRQGRLVDPVRGISGIMDVLVEDGKVAVTGSNISEPNARVIDVHGPTVCAGLVDMYVRLREPGLEYKETIGAGAAVAARGGFTSTARMPNVRPATDSPEQIAFVKQRAAEVCGVHVWPIGVMTRGQQGQELIDFEALKGAGAVTLSDDGVPIQNANLMRDGLVLVHRQSLTILSHCEGADMTKNYAVNEGRISCQLRLAGRPAIAEEPIVARDAMLVEEIDGVVHICHISIAKSVALVRWYKRKGVQIIRETCPQYFSFTKDETLAQGVLARVNLSPRTKADVEAVIEGLKDGTIDAVATDYAPHSAEEKARPLTDAPSGMVGLEIALAVVLTYLYHTGEMALPDILRRTIINLACTLCLPTKRRLATGSDGDMAIFDPDETWTVELNRFASKGRNTPFGGKTLWGKMKYTVVGGETVHWEGERAGRPLMYCRRKLSA